MADMYMLDSETYKITIPYFDGEITAVSEEGTVLSGQEYDIPNGRLVTGALQKTHPAPDRPPHVSGQEGVQTVYLPMEAEPDRDDWEISSIFLLPQWLNAVFVFVWHCHALGKG